MIYFDNAATTKPSKPVLDIYNRVSGECWHNASSEHKLGNVAKNLFTKAQQLVFKTLNATNKNVIFTSGATEANNIAIYGICNKYIGTSSKIITTKVEHPSVLNCFKDLESKGFKVVYLNILENGEIDYQQLINELDANTVLVSIMWVNNIIGSINNINKIIEIVRKYKKVKLHIDAVQGIGKIPLSFKVDDVDLLTLSSHKIHGLKGSGCLIYQNNINLDTFLHGSNQQLSKSGTIDLAGSVASAKALELAFKEIPSTYQHVLKIKEYLVNELSKLDYIHLNSSLTGSPYILNFSYKDVYSETIMHYLEENEIYVSISSACNDKKRKPERTVLELTKNEDLALTSIRLSFSSDNTLDDAKKFIDVIKKYRK